MDSFVVTHDSRKISSKPKEAVHCLPQKTLKSANVQEKDHLGLERLNKAIEIVNEERGRKEIVQDDVVSENTLNHLKEEVLPKVTTPVIQSHFITTPRGENVINTESEGKFQIPRAIVAPNRVHKKQRKPKISALKRNTRLLQSKLNIQTTEFSEGTDTATEVSSSSILTGSEEESEIDPSFAQSGEEDLTDDEDSGRDSFNSRYNKKKMKRKTLNETTAVHLHENHRSKSANKKKKEKLGKSEITALKDKCTTASVEKSSRDKFSTAKLAPTNCHGEHHLPEKNISNTSSNVKQKKPIQISQHVPREGPIATSSFKASTEEKTDVHRSENLEKQINDLKDDSKHFDGDTKRDMDVDKKQKSWFLNINANDNYMKFEETVMKLAKVNLNRSVSLNEADAFKDELTSRRRKRKYQSLRQARKESVFDVLQKLDIAPKKSILKKSKSVHVKSTAAETPMDSQMFMASDTNIKEPILNNADSDAQFTSKTHEHKQPKDTRCHVIGQYQKTSETDITEKVFANLQTSGSNISIAQNSETITSLNETEINDDEKFDQQSIDRDIHSDVKDKRSNEMLESKTDESVAVIRPHLYNENVQEKVEGVSTSKIMSSTSGSAAGIDSTNLDLSRRNVSNSNDKEAYLTFDRLSPILPNQVTHEQAFLQTNGISYLETNVGNENSESLSESTAVISSNSVTLDKVLQMKLRKKLIAFQSHRSKEMALSDDVDLVEMPIEQQKESSAELFKAKAKTASEDEDSEKNEEQENRTNVGKSDVVRGDHKAFTEKKENQMNELPDAFIFVSERGLIYTISNRDHIQTSTTEKAFEDETQQMTIDSKSKKLQNEVLRNQQTTDSSKISKDKTPSLQNICDKTKMAQVSKIQQTKCPQHSDVGDITHPLSLNSEYTSSPTQSADRSKSPTLTRDTSKTTTLQDTFKINSSYQENANLFSFSARHIDNTASVSKMRDEPDCDPIFRHSLSEPKDLKAIILETVSKPHPKDEPHPLLPNHRPKSADVFSRKHDFLETRPCKESVEQNNKYVDNTNTIHTKQTQEEFINETGMRRDFRVPGMATFSYRPKSTLIEMERSSKHTLESRRSKTPTFRPTYTSETDASNMSTLVAELKPKHQMFPLSKMKPNGLSVSNIESFSRNLPTTSRASFVPEHEDRPKGMNRASYRSKRAGPMPSYNTTLLTKREKEKNILNGRVNSRISSERERPKSAMSLRSAPRPTYLETVHPTLESSKRKVDKHNRNNPFGHENSSFKFPHGAVKQRMDIDEMANAILQADKMEHTDSDSEIENFFANPDAEVLQIGSKDDAKTNVIQDSEKAFAAYTKRIKPSKSISFKM